MVRRTEKQTKTALKDVLDESSASSRSSRSRTRRTERSQRSSSDSEPERPLKGNRNTSQRQQPTTSKNQSRSRNEPSTSRQPQSQSRSRYEPSTSRQPQRQQQQQPITGAGRRKQNRPRWMREIAQYQNTTDNLIPKAPFSRLLREILHSHGDYRVQSQTIVALQEATECYLVALFDDAFKLTLHRSRVTINESDIKLTLYIRGQRDPGVR